jgi:GT2 family glycosyltransferase
LFFIDDDNSVEPGVVDVLASLLDKRPELIEVGPAMYYAADPVRVYCLGTSHRGMFSRTRWILQPPNDRAREIISDALPNAFMVRRCDFEAIEGFDEVAFPMDFEESDLAFRLRQRHGGYLACSLDTRIWHHALISARQRLAPKSVARSYYSGRNRPIFIARHLGAGQWTEFVLMGQFGAAVTKLWGVCFGPNETGRSRAIIGGAYLAGMVAGVFISIGEFRQPLKSCMRNS